MDTFVKDNTTPQYRWNLKDLLRCLQRGERIVYTKFGDGEYFCIHHQFGRNCDQDTYTPLLGMELQKAFCTLVDAFNEQNERVWIGMWHEPHVSNYLATLYYRYKATTGPLQQKWKIPFVEYHTVYNTHDSLKNPDMYQFVKFIQTYPNKKLVISNPHNRRLQVIFRSTDYIDIPFNSWFAQGMYESIAAQLEDFLDEHPKSIVLMACGLATKVLIARVMQQYKQASFIDIGSGFDILARKVDTRGWTRGERHHTYVDECDYFSNLLPEDWKTLMPVFKGGTGKKLIF